MKEKELNFISRIAADKFAQVMRSIDIIGKNI
jgi:hypothetical protein